jgi:beta-lactamase superfamily II metal-dependent hydrolase
MPIVPTQAKTNSKRLTFSNYAILCQRFEIFRENDALMTKKYPFYPLVLALSPLLFFLAANADPLNWTGALRTGAIWLAGGVGLYAVLWLVFRSPQRAALLAAFALLLAISYDPLYELVRDRTVGGFVYGRHRYLAPLWGGLLLADAYVILRWLKRPERLTAALNLLSLPLLIYGLVSVTLAGAWQYPLRAAGLIPPPQVEVTYINVGQPDETGFGGVGESILLRTSEGKTALIDGGYPNGQAAAYLRASNITHLDLVVLSHAHDDHSGGLVEILGEIPADLLVMNGQPLDTPVYRQLEAVIQEKSIPTQVVRSGDRLVLGSLIFEVLSPNYINPDSVNINSVVLRLEVGRVSFLFTGDTEHGEELRLLEAGLAEEVDIHKIAHHGAVTSSHPDYVVSISPEVAIYSVGPGNAPHYPNQEALERFRSNGAELYGTLDYGTIIVNTDGRTYEVLTERGEEQ